MPPEIAAQLHNNSPEVQEAGANADQTRAVEVPEYSMFGSIKWQLYDAILGSLADGLVMLVAEKSGLDRDKERLNSNSQILRNCMTKLAARFVTGPSEKIKEVMTASGD